MSRTASQSEEFKGNQKLEERDRILRFLASGGIVVAISLAVLLLRFYRLESVPPGIQNDEGPDGVYALGVLQGEHAVFFPELGSGREAIGVYANALSTAILGRTLLAFHLPVALASAATVFVVFWLGQLLFGKDEESTAVAHYRGLLIAGVGAGLMAVSISQTLQSRAALRATYLPFLLALSLALLWLGWRNRSIWLVALAGIFTGLLPYTYNAARFTPFLYLLLGLSFLLPFGREVQNRKKSEILPAAVFMVVVALVASPLLVYFAANPEDFFIRSTGVWLFGEGQGNPLGTFLKNVWEYILLFGFHGDRLPRYNFAGRPMLNFFEALLFWVGVVAAGWKWRCSPAHRLLLIWLFILVLPAMLTRDAGYGPNSLRIIGASPAIYLLIGTGLWEGFRQLQQRILDRPRLSRFQSGKKNVTAAAAVMFVVCTWTLVQGVATYRTFFQLWVGTPEYFRWYHAEWADAAQALNTLRLDAGTAVFLPYPLNNEHFGEAHHGFDYLYQGAAPAQVIAATTPHNLAQKIEAKLAKGESVSTVKLVDWDNEIVGGDTTAERHAAAVLGKYGRHTGSENYGNFQIHTYADVSLARPWTLYERLEPRTIHYDGGISLLGFALGQGIEQVSSLHQFEMAHDRSWWIAFQWLTAPGLDVVYSISLRLHDSDGRLVSQHDAVLINSTPLPTSKWQKETPVDTMHILEFDSDLAPGEYELRLVVYDFESLQPTVELGVWEPETTITYLHFGELK